MPETTTVWSFPDRGDWATHVGNYRGNWSPYIPRNLILRYTAPGDLVLDQMAGSGTTAMECKLLGRRATGYISSYAPLNADYVALEIKTYVGDAGSFDLIGISTCMYSGNKRWGSNQVQREHEVV